MDYWKDVYDKATVALADATFFAWPQNSFDHWWRQRKRRTMVSKGLAELFFNLGWRAAYQQWYRMGFFGVGVEVIRSVGASDTLLLAFDDRLARFNYWHKHIASHAPTLCEWALARYLDRNSFAKPSAQQIDLAKAAFIYGAETKSHDERDRCIKREATYVQKIAMKPFAQSVVAA